MEDAVTAAIMAFSILVFVIALSATMYLVNTVTATSEQILYYADSSNFFENISVNGNELTKRRVDFDTIIPTLYRYNKESFCVKICDGTDSSGNNISKSTVLQVFDVDLEEKVRNAAALTVNEREKPENAAAQALHLMYNDPSRVVYMFESPWLGNRETDCKTRVDYYINGTAGFINNQFVNYASTISTDIPGEEINNLKEYKEKYDSLIEAGKKPYIEETFVEYNYAGDTISSEDGLETITGNKQALSKIIITYTLKVED